MALRHLYGARRTGARDSSEADFILSRNTPLATRVDMKT